MATKLRKAKIAAGAEASGKKFKKGAKFADPEIPGVIDMGSPYDEGSSDAPQEPQGEPVEVIPDSEQPPTVIEIAQYEEGMEDVLIG